MPSHAQPVVEWTLRAEGARVAEGEARAGSERARCVVPKRRVGASVQRGRQQHARKCGAGAAGKDVRRAPRRLGGSVRAAGTPRVGQRPPHEKELAHSHQQRQAGAGGDDGADGGGLERLRLAGRAVYKERATAERRAPAAATRAFMLA